MRLRTRHAGRAEWRRRLRRPGVKAASIHATTIAERVGGPLHHAADEARGVLSAAAPTRRRHSHRRRGGGALFLVLLVAAGAWWWRRKRDLEFARLQREPDAPLDSPAAPWTPGAGLHADGGPPTIEANGAPSTVGSTSEAVPAARNEGTTGHSAGRPSGPPRMRATQNGAESARPATFAERSRAGGRAWRGASLPPPTAIKPPDFRAGPPSGPRRLP